MKKIVILLVLILFTSGCYDYVELNNLAIISGVAIDRNDDNFSVVYEILNTINREENQNEPKVYFAKGEGKTIAEAFLNCSYEVPKNAYFAHIDTVVISEEIAKNHVKDIVDFLIRDVDVRNQFYFTVAIDNTAEEIIKTTNATDPIASTSIKNLIEQTSKKKNITSALNYEEFLAHALGKRKDGYLTTVTKKDDVLKIGPIAIFNDYNMQTVLNNEDAANFNVLNNTSHESTYKINCPNDNQNNIIMATSIPASTELKFNNNEANYKINMEVRVVENHCEIDLRNIDDLKKIEEILEKKVESDMTKLITTLKDYDSDILEVAERYYQQQRKNIDFRQLNYNFKTEVLINRNGLIFEVKNDNK